MVSKQYKKLGIGFLGAAGFLIAFPAYGGIIDDLRSKITGKSTEIERLEQEINEYQKQVSETSKQAKTLQTSVKTLETTQKKLEKDITLTETKLETTTYKIEKITVELGDTASRIEQGNKSIIEMLRTIDEIDQASLVEVMFSNESLADFWDRAEGVARVQEIMSDRVSSLKLAKDELETKKFESEAEKRALARFQDELGDRKVLVDQNKKTKAQLLAETKSKESNYRKILAEKQALMEAFEKELRSYESQLKMVIDQDALPTRGSESLSWPLARVILTQYFGNTEFAKSGAYNGSGHNGIDLGVAVGTKVMASAAGVVTGAGDTDKVCPGASYGKWVLVKHENGLSTLYAHLSLIKVSEGESVPAGGLVGYSGNTGYSTGPHLHFTVYATEGVQVQSRKSKVCGGTYTMPIAPLNAYLNPLDYLPPLP
ncbi:MAG: hypothetical protein A2408_01625 [Candidatus Yonathbacteria bacterium RIFOXYC1_FULL_52_10]|uniref:M23ase beta-sheet core domain-containing protein n=1 Tax=Candidatus Yonathbacteria bacterium RIFOXYD1_FULL_52_36 TaxID=1802730 RepID=A0A1G2SL50_9BACT|nr:MAG: hypothetical protein A2408_01625 [Candidatus Yonathbacteria bacterium RIFOXYC1_FULL_52_10]OHA85770.1 MAG: hypothetical protein A2591_02795 [Candidatus Yonathbacteria bacterium RIFOXYD1_FULL_52_36]